MASFNMEPRSEEGNDDKESENLSISNNSTYQFQTISNSLPLPNKPLIHQVESAKQELAHHFQRYDRMLYNKYQQMLLQLDDILLSVNDLYKRRSELRETQGELEERLRNNQFSTMKGKMLEPLLSELSELEQSISRTEREVLVLAWKDPQLETAIEESCAVSQREPVVRIYKDMQAPVWSAVSRGDGNGQVTEAKGLAIDPENEDIYIADKKKNRIVIFNRDGKFQHNLTVDKIYKPQSLLLIDEHCFIACDMPGEGLIVKANKRNGVLSAEFKPGRNVIALTLDLETDVIFCSPLTKASIWHFQQKNLEKVSEVKLHTPHFKDNTQIHAIQVRKDEIFILFENSHSPLQSFSRDGKIFRNMILPAGLVKGSRFFTIDSHQNFIISDHFDNRIKIFSPTGSLITAIGEDATEANEGGELYAPRGVALTRNGNIIVCDRKNKNILQMF